MSTGGHPGRWIRVAAWVTNALLAAATVPDALGVDAWSGVSVTTSLALFLVSLPVWTWAMAVAVVRSAQGDDLAVGSVFLFQRGSAPPPVRRDLLGALVVNLVVVAAVAAENPFAVLVPMLSLGWTGLWGARHGTYPPRRVRQRHPGPRR